jgi:decaprenyl-phosphate phosphoribosyltransferase
VGDVPIAVARANPPSPFTSLIRGLRPRQWSKNVLVFVAPAAAGAFHHREAVLRSLGAFGIFCAAASSTYLFNDSVDVESDRHHPVKRNRPIAAGDLPVPLAVSVGVVLGAGSIGASWALAGWKLALIVGLYAVLSAAYTVHFKKVPVIELAFVASGFVLRALAGGVATHVPISTWFLAVTSFGALFVATGKRAAELKLLGDDPADHRRTLGDYTTSFLQSTLTLTAAVTVTAYCLWAFGSEGLARSIRHDTIWIQLTVVPVTLGILHVLRLLDRGEGGAPEDLVLNDRVLQVLGISWVALFAAGLYG